MSEGLRRHVIEVGRKLGRTEQDVDPFIELLNDHWYDTAESLADLSAEDFVALGIPLRFAKELASASGGDRAPRASHRDQARDQEPRHAVSNGVTRVRSTGSQEVPKGKGKDRADKKGHKERPDDAEHQGRERGKGKGKGKGKTNPDEDEHSMTLPLEIEALDQEFPWKKKILGEKAANIRHIREQTGATLWLRGAGSGFKEEGGKQGESEEPMYVHVSGKSQSGVEKAVEMAQDLLGAVMDEYYEWESWVGADGRKDDHSGDRERRGGKGKEKGKEKGKGKGKGKSKGKGKGKEKGKHDDEDGADRKRARYH